MKQTLLKISGIAVGAFLFSSIAMAQLGNAGQFIGGLTTSGVDDVEKQLNAYMTPFVNAFGASINGGWYSTAKPHKLGGFDLTFTTNFAAVPEDAQTYDLNDLGLAAQVSGDGIAPTFAGDRNAETPELSYVENILGQNVTVGKYNVPKGAGVRIVPAPVAKIGIGFIKDTELSGRYMPDVKFGKTTMGMWGFGLKHGLKQYIPAVKKLPIIHLTYQFGYTKFYTNNALSVTPTDLGLVNSSTFDFNDQEMNTTISAFTTNLLFSVDVPFLAVYCGVGIARSKANLQLLGHYPTPSFTSLANGTAEVTDNSVMENPIDMEVKNTEGSITKPRLNGGFKVKLGVVHINFDYTYAYYSVFTGGIGISFR